jgi:cytochrome P450
MGQWVMIPIYAIHRDPLHWGPDAADFRPERWLEGSQQQLKFQAASFMPFGDGPRSCPGSKFAVQEAKLALFRVLERCTLELAYPNVHPPPLIPHLLLSALS